MKIVNTFEKGLNKDLSPNKFDNQSYFHAENMTLFHNEDGTILSFKTSKGNSLATTLFQNGVTINGIIPVGNDRIAIFYNRKLVSTIRSYIAISSATDNSLWSVCFYDDNSSLTDSPLIGENIEGIYRKDTDDVERIYWIDGVNELRCIDINIVNRDINLISFPGGSVTPTITCNKLSNGGNMKSGAVQYAIQYFNVRGLESSIKTCTDLIYITKNNNCGEEIGTDCNKSVPLVIDHKTNGTYYKKFRVYALFYDTYNAVPRVYIVDDFAKWTTNVLDTGVYQSEITFEEFLNLSSPSNFIANLLEEKDNYLFLGNVKEDTFYIDETDFDARAFRTLGNGNNFIVDGISYSVPNNLPPAKADCVQTDFDNYCWNAYGGSSKYRGASGKNIEVRERCPDFLTDYMYSTYGFSNIILDNETSNEFPVKYTNTDLEIADYSANTFKTSKAANVSTYTTHAPLSWASDEVMRFAIRFENYKGQKSNPLWICDYKTNHRGATGWELTFSYAGKLYAKPILIDFTVTLPTDFVEKFNIKGYQILYCERTENERTNLASGFYLPVIKDSTDNWMVNAKLGSYYYNSPITVKGKSIDYSVGSFYSPEVAINKNINWQLGDKLMLLGYLNLTSISGSTAVAAYNTDYSKKYLFYKALQQTNTIKDAINLANAELFTGYTQYSKISFYAPSGNKNVKIQKTTIGDKGYNNSSTQLLVSSSNLNIYSSFNNYTDEEFFNHLPLVYYKRYLDSNTFYGGNKFNSRKNNTYIPCSDFVDYTTNNVMSKGDTYITMFPQFISYVNNNGSSDLQQVLVHFPCETSINTNFMMPEIGKYITGLNSADSTYYMQERRTEGIAQNYDATTKTTFYPEDCGDLYRYNSVYSQQNKGNSFIPIPEDLINTFNPYRVYSTGRKIYGENSDSWLKIDTTKYLDVNGKFGELTKLFNYRNQLVAFQEKGVSILSVNQRSLINDGGNNATLSLGTGGILERYDYVSTTSGTRYKKSVVESDGLYWFDDINKGLFVLQDTSQPFSKVKGLNNYLKNLNLTSVVSAFDSENSKMLITLNTTDQANRTTLVFNTLSKTFIEFYSYGCSEYIKVENNILFHDKTDKIYNYNKGDYGMFYNSVSGTLEYKPSKLSFIINPGKEVFARFDLIELISKSIDSTGVEIQELFTSVRFSNSYQDSGEIFLTTSNTRRLFREWRFNQLRDLNGKRFLDYYLKIDLTYNNSDNKQFSLTNLSTFYELLPPY